MAGAHWRLELRRLRDLGSHNARRLRQEAELVCVTCACIVDPARGDVFDRGAWWCQRCWKETLS